MSRIHEALKKAEQERSPDHLMADGAAREEVIAAPASKTGSAGETLLSVSEASNIATASADYLRFDDLRARCAHPE